jgi:hypothetical protein
LRTCRLRQIERMTPRRFVHRARNGDARAFAPPTQHPFAALAAQGTSRNTEALTFYDVAEVPADREQLSDTASETWHFVRSWSDRRSALGPRAATGTAEQTEKKVDRYRHRSPFLVFDKSSRQWSTVAVSRHAYEIYPVRRDPHDPALIWFGATTGPTTVSSTGPACSSDWRGRRSAGIWRPFTAGSA